MSKPVKKPTCASAAPFRPAAARPAALPARREALGPPAARRPAHRRPAALPARPPAPCSAAAAVAHVATQFRGRRTHAERVLRSGRTVKGSADNGCRADSVGGAPECRGCAVAYVLACRRAMTGRGACAPRFAPGRRGSRALWVPGCEPSRWAAWLSNTLGSQALEAIAVTLPHLATPPVSRVHSSPRRAPRADIFADSPLPSPSYVKLSG